MANIKSIGGNPIVVNTDGVEDGSMTDAKLAQSGGVLKRSNSLVYGVRDFMASAVAYKGYFDANGNWHDSTEQGLTSGWGTIVVQVKRGSTIDVSGFGTTSGTYSWWLNSAELDDKYGIAWSSTNNDGKHICWTDYIALCVHNTQDKITDMSVKEYYDENLENAISGKFDTIISDNLLSGARYIHVPCNITAGQVIRISASKTTIDSSTGVNLYYNNDGNKNVGTVVFANENVIEFVATENISQLDGYLMGGPSSGLVTVTWNVVGEYTLIKETIENGFENNGCNYDVKHVNFNMTSGVGHSSRVDRIYKSVDADTLFYLYIKSSTGSIPAYMVSTFDDSDNATANYISTGAVTTSPASWESYSGTAFESLGVFVTAPEQDTEIDVYLLTKKTDAQSQAVYLESSYDINNRYSFQSDYLAPLLYKLCFMVTTDVHDFKQHYLRACDFYHAHKPDMVNDLLNLGDLVYDRYDNGTTILENDVFKSSLFVLGNHDVWLQDGGIITQSQAYDRYYAANIASWGVTQPDNAANLGLCYYYKDYPASVGGPLRMIFIDEYHYDQMQHEWFVSVLEECATSGTPVVVCTHQQQCTSSEMVPFSDDYPFACPTGGYNNQPMADGYAGTYTNAYINRRKAVDTFKASGGIFVCWMAGHTHRDGCGYFVETNGKQLQLTFINTSQDITSKAFIKSNYSGDSFQYVAFDTSKKNIYVLRIGTTVDLWMHRNQFMVCNYETASLVEYN